MEMLEQRIAEVYSYRHSLWDMAVKQLKAKYSGSTLGIFWAIINPLLIALAVTFVFTVVFKIEMKNFALFVLAGIFPWMFFSATLSEVTFSILNQQNIIRNSTCRGRLFP